MAIYWLAAHDGSALFKCVAPDIGQAFELYARSLKYNSFADFTLDTGATPADFQIAEIREERGNYDAEGNRKEIKTQEDNTVVGAFRQLLRKG